LAEKKAGRDMRRQLGQFMTPANLAQHIVDGLNLTSESRVLEPSFGKGAFLIPLVKRLMSLHEGSASQRLDKVMSKNLYGVEIDPVLYQSSLTLLELEFGRLPTNHNLLQGDFFRTEYFHAFFDLVVGNPPYGGTFDPEIEDVLDRLYGLWDGHKLKKETYSFFTARALDWLRPGGSLHFIISDTMLTIKTMGGLRRRLMDSGSVVIQTLSSFSEETSQPTLVLEAVCGKPTNEIYIDGRRVSRDLIELTGNFSWQIDESMAVHFRGPKIGDYLVASSGMTIGNNEYFLRAIDAGRIIEPYEFAYFDDPITLEGELERARLHKLSPKLQQRIATQEADGEKRRNLRVTQASTPKNIRIPHPDYRYYNKATSGIVYEAPRTAIFWKNGGEAVLTFKKNGPWYLHGVGGQKFFGREGLTWQLISPRLNMRYLPPGYILDSGAPAMFLRDGVPYDELWFVLGWCLTNEATRILKKVINHTRNIQSKDVERLPYPYWVKMERKREIVSLVANMVKDSTEGFVFNRTSPELLKLEEMFLMDELR
jgi:hypothetical protein